MYGLSPLVSGIAENKAEGVVGLNKDCSIKMTGDNGKYNWIDIKV